MKDIILATLAANTPQFVVILFWLILAIWLLSLFKDFTANPHYIRGTSFIIILLFAILGFALFRFGP